MSQMKHDSGRLLLVRAGKPLREGDFHAHLMALGRPACGLALVGHYEQRTSSYVPNWGAVLCPTCRLLLDEELAALVRNHQGNRKPLAAARGGRGC